MDTDPLERAVKLAGGQSALAKALGVKQGHVWYWLNGAKRVPAEHCAAIEEATGGAVKRFQLRPDLFEEEPVNGGPAPQGQSPQPKETVERPPDAA